MNNILAYQITHGMGGNLCCREVIVTGPSKDGYTPTTVGKLFTATLVSEVPPEFEEYRELFDSLEKQGVAAHAEFFYRIMPRYRVTR